MHISYFKPKSSIEVQSLPKYYVGTKERMAILPRKGKNYSYQTVQ